MTDRATELLAFAADAQARCLLALRRADLDAAEAWGWLANRARDQARAILSVERGPDQLETQR